MKVVTIIMSDYLAVEKQPILLQELAMPISQWSQNLNASVIEQVEKRGKKADKDEMEDFGEEFKKKFGLHILNLNEYSIDTEHNVGAILVDFGEVGNEGKAEKIIRVKNNSDKEIIFEEPLFLANDDVKFDWGSKPIKIGETRDLKVILNLDETENESYSYFSVSSNVGTRIPMSY